MRTIEDAMTTHAVEIPAHLEADALSAVAWTFNIDAKQYAELASAT